jgi:hypothetical protein
LALIILARKDSNEVEENTSDTLEDKKNRVEDTCTQQDSMAHTVHLEATFEQESKEQEEGLDEIQKTVLALTAGQNSTA